MAGRGGGASRHRRGKCTRQDPVPPICGPDAVPCQNRRGRSGQPGRQPCRHGIHKGCRARLRGRSVHRNFRHKCAASGVLSRAVPSPSSSPTPLAAGANTRKVVAARARVRPQICVRIKNLTGVKTIKVHTNCSFPPGHPAARRYLTAVYFCTTIQYRGPSSLWLSAICTLCPLLDACLTIGYYCPLPQAQ